MAREKVLSIKVNVEEKQRIIAAAQCDERTYSDWCRRVLRDACEKSEAALQEGDEKQAFMAAARAGRLTPHPD